LTQGAILRNPRTKYKRLKNVFTVTCTALSCEHIWARLLQPFVQSLIVSPCALRMSRHQPRLFRILDFENCSGLTIQTSGLNSNQTQPQLNFASTCPSVISQTLVVLHFATRNFANTCRALFRKHLFQPWHRRLATKVDRNFSLSNSSSHPLRRLATKVDRSNHRL